jgi:Pentapeptide repeats (8 copies)
MKYGAQSRGRLDRAPEDRQLIFDAVDLHEADYSGRKVVHFVATASRFDRCRFERMVADHVSFGAGVRPSLYRECTFDGSWLRIDVVGRARFERCSFANVRLSDLRCHEAEFVGCTFSGRIERGFFNGTVLPDQQRALGRIRNEIRENDFSGMDLLDVSFRTGVDLRQQRLPEGPEYLYIERAASAIESAWKDVSGWRGVERNEGLAILGSLRLDLEGGQDQILIRCDEPGSKSSDVGEAVLVLLRRFAGRD